MHRRLPGLPLLGMLPLQQNSYSWSSWWQRGLTNQLWWSLRYQESQTEKFLVFLNFKFTTKSHSFISVHLQLHLKYKGTLIVTRLAYISTSGKSRAQSLSQVSQMPCITMTGAGGALREGVVKRTDPCSDSASWQASLTIAMLGKEEKPCLGLNYLAQPGPDLTFCWFFFSHLDTGKNVTPCVSQWHSALWVGSRFGISPLNFENRAGYKTEIAKWTWDPMVSSKL